MTISDSQIEKYLDFHFIDKLGIKNESASNILFCSPLYGDYCKRIEQSYLDRLITHKTAVYRAGIELYSQIGEEFDIDKDKFMYNLVVHDASKLSHVEYEGYYGYDFKDKDNNTPNQYRAFRAAWIHHYINNHHHVEHYSLVKKDGTTELADIPDIYLLEMIADWKGGCVYGDSFEVYLQKNLHKFLFTTKTAERLKKLLSSLEYRDKIELHHYSTKTAKLKFY